MLHFQTAWFKCSAYLRCLDNWLWTSTLSNHKSRKQPRGCEHPSENHQWNLRRKFSLRPFLVILPHLIAVQPCVLNVFVYSLQEQFCSLQLPSAIQMPNGSKYKLTQKVHIRTNNNVQLQLNSFFFGLFTSAAASCAKCRYTVHQFEATSSYSFSLKLHFSGLLSWERWSMEGQWLIWFL